MGCEVEETRETGEAARKKPGRFRCWVLRPLGWSLALAAVLILASQLLIDTPGVRRRLGDAIAARLGSYLERPVEIADVELALLPASVEVRGLVIGGPEGFDEPFLEVPWAVVDFDLDALRRRDLHLRRIRVERPRFNLRFLPGGVHNVVRFRRRGTRPRRFDVHIDRIEVDRAEWVLDHEAVRLSFSADAVRARLQGVGEMHVAGQLVGQNVIVRLPRARSREVAVAIQGSIRRGRVEVESARISSPGFSAQVHGNYEWSRGVPRQRKCQFQASGKIRGAVLAELGYFPDLRGEVEYDGEVAWRPGAFGWRSRVRAAELTVWDRRLTEVSGTLVADRYGARFALDRATYAEGELEGTIAYEIRRPPGQPPSGQPPSGEPASEASASDPSAAPNVERTVTVDLNFRALTLNQLLADQQIPAGECAARLRGHLLYRFALGRSARGDGHGEVEVIGDEDRSGLPLEGAFALRIADGVVRSDAIALRSNRQSVLASGWYDLDRKRGVYAYEIASADLAELGAVIFPEPEEPLLWLPTAGEGEIAGTLYVYPGEVTSDVRLRLSEVLAPALPGPRTVTGGLHYTPQLVAPLRLEVSGDGDALMLQGRVPLGEDNEQGMAFTINAFAWPMAAVHPWLPFSLDLDGRISGHLNLYVGREDSDGDLRATVSPAVAAGIPLESVSGRVSWDAEELRVTDLVLTAAAGRVTGQGTLAWDDEALEVRFETPGLELGAAPLRSYLPRPDVSGQVTAWGRVGGRLDRPELSLTVAADGMVLGRRRLTRPSQLDVRWAEGRLNVHGLVLDMVTINGGGTLDQGRGDLVFVLDGSDLGGLVELFSPRPSGLDGIFGGRLRIAGESGTFPAVDLEIEELEVDFRGRRLSNREPVVVRLGRDHLTIRSLYMEEEATGSDLFVSGRVGYEGTAPLDLRLQSTLAADWMALIEPALVYEGYVDLLGRVGGTAGRPYLDGQGEVRQGGIRFASESAGFPHSLEGIEGVVLFYPEEIVIDRLSAQLAGGRLAVEGRVAVPRRDEAPSYRLQLVGDDLRLRFPEGWLLRGDLELVLRSLAAGRVLTGRADLRGVETYEDMPVGFAELMRDFLRRQRLEAREADEILTTTQLNVVITAPGGVRVRNNLADLGGSAELLLRGTLGQPVLFGEVDVDPGGRLVYNQTEYEITRGRFTFTNPYAPDPEVDLVATTRVRDFDVTLTLSGTLERLNAGFSSEPPLPDLEVFQLLASGGEGPNESRAIERPGVLADQSTSAATFLYGQAASVIGDRVSDLFGFDKFRIDPLTGSGDNLSQARVTVGKRLTKDLYLTYSADPSSTEDQRLQVEWRLGGGLTLVLTQNGDDTYSADARWETSF